MLDGLPDCGGHSVMSVTATIGCALHHVFQSPVSADAMLSSELGNRYAATRVYHGGPQSPGGRLRCTRSRRREAARSNCSSYESTLNAVRWRAASVSPLSRNHYKRRSHEDRGYRRN